MPGGGVPASGLIGRRRERGMLEQLIDTVRAGGSRVLVVRGEPGIGKSALLDYLTGQASGCRVVRAAGVESELWDFASWQAVAANQVQVAREATALLHLQFALNSLGHSHLLAGPDTTGPR
jgi:ABC-type transport system involved in cytochrome c biogenesis ATPase subunit